MKPASSLCVQLGREEQCKRSPRVQICVRPKAARKLKRTVAANMNIYIVDSDIGSLGPAHEETRSARSKVRKLRKLNDFPTCLSFKS